MRQLVTTGIRGLDRLLQGGLLAGTCNLVEGVPGAGKTTVGIQFIYAGALNGEPGIIVTFEEFPRQLKEDARNFGWDLDGMEAAGLVRIICTSPDVFLEQLQDSSGLIDTTVVETGATRLLLDSVTNLGQIGATPNELRAIVYSMMNGLRRAGLTSVITKELQTIDSNEVPFEEYLADSVLRLRYDVDPDGQRRRYVEVLKSRGVPHIPGRHTLELTSEGVVVYPRYRPSHDDKVVWRRGLCRTPTGVPGLDEMLGGGLICGTSWLVAGSAGVGKTTLALQFLCQGPAVDQRGVYLSFQESPTKLTELARVYGLALDQLVADEHIRLMHRTPLETRVDRLIYELCEEVKCLGAQRVVVDSLTDLSMATPTESSLREAVYALADALESCGATTLFITEVPELFGQTQISGQHLSIIVDGIILLKYVEMASEIQRAVSVLKMRGSDHDKGIRRFVITNRGMAVMGRFEGTEGLMGGSPRHTTIELAVRSYSEFDERLNEELLARFAQLHPHVKPVRLSIPYNPDEALDVIQRAVAAPHTSLSVAPLCMYWMPDIIQPDKLSPLNDVLPPEAWSLHLDGLIKPAVLDETLYAVPAIALCGVLLYRKDLLEQCGFYNPPATWDELVHQAKTILAAAGNENLIGFEFPGYSYEGLSSSFLVNLWSNGGDVLDAQGNVILHSDNALQAITYMRDLIHTHGISPSNLTTPAIGLEPQTNFLAGRTVFLWMLPTVFQSTLRIDSPIRDRVGIAPPPIGPLGTQAHSFLGGWHYAVPRGAEAPSTAREFIRFITSEDIQKERALRGGPLPTLKALYEDPEILSFHPYYRDLRAMLATARSREEIPRYLSITKAIQRHLHPVLQGRVDPEAALSQLANEVRQILQAP